MAGFCKDVFAAFPAISIVVYLATSDVLAAISIGIAIPCLKLMASSLLDN